MRVAFCKIGNAVDCGADHRFSFVDDLLHAGLCSIGSIRCRFTACGLRRRARPGGGIVAFVDFLPLFPAGKPVGTALAGAGCTCILCGSRLLRGRFCGFGAILAPHLGFLFQLPGIDALGNIPDISCCLFTLAQSLCAHIIVLVLVNLPMHRRPGGMGGVHLPLLRLAQPAQFVRGQLRFAKPQVLRPFRSLICIGFQFFLSGHRLFHPRFLRGRTGLFYGRFLFDVQLRITHFCVPSEVSLSLVVRMR